MDLKNYKPGKVIPISKTVSKSTYYVHTKKGLKSLQDCNKEEFLEYAEDLLNGSVDIIEGYVDTITDRQSFLELVFEDKIENSTSLFGHPDQWKTYREMIERIKEKEQNEQGQR